MKELFALFFVLVCAVAEVAAQEQIVCGLPHTIDEYGKLSWNDERARLDNIAAYLNRDAESKVLIVGSATAQSDLNDIRLRLVKAKNFLVAERKIDAARIIIAVDNSDYQTSEYTKITSLPPDAFNLNSGQTMITEDEYLRLLKDLKRAKKRIKRNKNK